MCATIEREKGREKAYTLRRVDRHARNISLPRNALFRNNRPTPLVRYFQTKLHLFPPEAGWCAKRIDLNRPCVGIIRLPFASNLAEYISLATIGLSVKRVQLQGLFISNQGLIVVL